jgi:hypothetical protein
VRRDRITRYFYSVFSSNKFSGSQIDMPRRDFECCQIFVDVFVFITGESRLPGVFTTGELRLAGVFITGGSFWTPGSHFNDFKAHTTIFNGSIILKIDCRLL